MPKVTGKLLSVYKNSFVIKGAKIWNKLPYNLTIINNLNSFKRKIDDYLKLYPNRPPVKGYYHINSNSLLDYQTIKT